MRARSTIVPGNCGPAALEEVLNARVFAGIHFRSACEAGQKLGKAVAQHVLTHAIRPLNGGKKLGHLDD